MTRTHPKMILRCASLVAMLAAWPFGGSGMAGAPPSETTGARLVTLQNGARLLLVSRPEGSASLLLRILAGLVRPASGSVSTSTRGNASASLVITGTNIGGLSPPSVRSAGLANPLTHSRSKRNCSGSRDSSRNVGAFWISVCRDSRGS